VNTVQQASESGQSLRSVVRADLGSASSGQRAALVGVIAWMGYEWGLGNEMVTPWLLARLIRDHDGVVAIPLVALVGFVFTAAQQLAAGFTALAAFSMFERTSGAMWTRLTHRSLVRQVEWSHLSLRSRCLLSFSLGTTAVALAQIMSTGEIGVRRHAATIVRSALLCAALVAAIGSAVAALAVVGRHVHQLHHATDWTVRVLGNPLLWVGLFVIAMGSRLVRARATSH
jgi:hypothetical protein